MKARIAVTMLAVVIVAISGRALSGVPAPRAIRLASAEAPVAADARGRLVYERYGCAMCHGTDGKGGFPNPNAETDGKVPGVIYVAEGYTRAELRRKILDGVVTIGRADPNGPPPPFRMPGWKGQMTTPDIDDLVEYLFAVYPKSAAETWR